MADITSFLFEQYKLLAVKISTETYLARKVFCSMPAVVIDLNIMRPVNAKKSYMPENKKTKYSASQNGLILKTLLNCD